MDIYKTTDSIDFSKINLEHPTGLQGGGYFTRIKLNGDPLYIQTNSCLTKSGIVRTNKKTYCDLMFNGTDSTNIDWFDNLEKICIGIIYDKKELWFQNEMDLEDIESSFNTPIRLYKSGKYYLIRTTLANSIVASGKFSCYDENNNPLSLDNVKENVKIIPLIEVLGIKFTSKNFTLELALKQIMVLKEIDFLDTCFIKRENLGNNNSASLKENTLKLENEVKNPEVADSEVENQELKNQELENQELENQELENQELKNQELENQEVAHLEVENQEVEHPDDSELVNSELNDKEIGDHINDKIESEDLLNLNNSEVNIHFDDLENDPVELRSPDEVYYDLWYAAKEKARASRQEAIQAYLEAKKIKDNYLLNELSDSSDEEEDLSNYLGR